MNTTFVKDSKSASHADQNDRMDQLGAELADSVYQLALRETKPPGWLDLELGLWKEISKRLESSGAESCLLIDRTP